ncbi:DUF4097 family beta strand repeat-containing protein [Pedobacter endophyticus]|uniref:Adhesin domain-containing protein n=1 Tax=Pedobacter endophyticus TaxID=2789740 RepID=A0A7U3Q3H4_9SPHI|nr:hypothetical protein [Pedobacter endophyticus]QPH37828.1 hypothetical protein IZT61_11970 [Pedobacter endophyticus]
MKKQLLFLALLTVCLSAAAQKEYKLAKSSGKLNLNISGAILEGYNGNEIIFSAKKTEPDEVDERAKGLKAINSSGFTDNTGLGLDVSVKGDEINVNPVSLNNQTMVNIKVPQNIKVLFTNSNSIYRDSIILRNLKNEIEVSVSFNEVRLENNTGPMNIKALHSSVDAVFPAEIKGPVSIVSVYGHVDVALPQTVKVNLEAGTNYGKIYAADGLKIVVDKEKEAEANGNNGYSSVVGTVNGINIVNSAKAPLAATRVAVGVKSPRVINFTTRSDAENIKGKINGGGADLILKSNHDNIYIRQK